MRLPFRSRLLAALICTGTAGAAEIPSWDRYASFTAGADARQVQVLDVDGDGRPDLVIADPAAAAIRVLRNQGDGVFSAAEDLGPALSGVRMLGLGDFAGDGATDLVAIRSNGLTDEAVVLVRGATGFSEYARKTFAPQFEVQDVATGKLCGGVLSDIVVAGRRSDGSGAAVQVLINQHVLGFSDPVSTPLADNCNPAMLTVARLDGDANPDVLVAMHGSGQIGLLYNPNASGLFTTASYSAEAGARHIAVQTDAGGTAKLIAVACETADTVLVFENFGGLLSPPLPLALPAGTAPRQVRSADLDADGDADFAVLGSGDGVHLLLNQGGQMSWTGTLADRFPPTGSPRQLRIADLSGDGRLDLLMLRTDGTGAAGSDALYVRLSQQQAYASSSSVFSVAAAAPPEWLPMNAQVRESAVASSGWMAATVGNTADPGDAGFIARRSPGNGMWSNLGLPAIPGARFDNLDLRVNTAGEIAVTCTAGPLELMAWYGSSGTWLVPSTEETTQAWDVDREGVAFLGGRAVSGSMHAGLWMGGSFIDHFDRFSGRQGNVLALSNPRAVGVTADDIVNGPFWPVYNPDLGSGDPYITALPAGGSILVSQPPVSVVTISSIERARIVDGGIAYDFQPDDGVNRHVVLYQTNAGIGSSYGLIHVAPAAGHDSASLEDARRDGLMLLRSWSVGAEAEGSALLWSSTFRAASPLADRLIASASTAFATSVTDDGAILSSGGLAMPTPTVSIVATDSDAARAGDAFTVRIARTGSTLTPLSVPLDTTAFDLQEPAPITAIIPAGRASVDLTLTLASDLNGNRTVALLPAGTQADAEHNYRIGQRGSVAIMGGTGNLPPSLSGPREAICTKDAMTQLILTVSDDSTAASALNVSCVASSDSAMIHPGSVLVGGSAGTRTANVHISGAAATGYAELTFRATDGDGASSDWIVLCMVGDVTATVAVSDAVHEDRDTTGAFTVTLSHPAPPGGVVVNLGYDGSASSSSDYQAPPLSATVPAGQTSVVFPITIIDDLVPEEAETIAATLGVGLYNASPTPAILTIPSSDVQHWVFWVQRQAVGGADQGIGQLVWWMTTIRPVASAVFRIPGKPDVAAEISVGADRTLISYPFWRVFGQDAVAMTDLQSYLPVSANADDLGYSCEITYADGLPASELRRGSFLGFAGGYEGIPIANNLGHGAAVTLPDGQHLQIDYDGPLTYVGINPHNGRLDDRSRWEGRPDQQGAVGNSFTAPPILAAGQPYVVELMRGRFSLDNGRDDEGGAVGLCYSNFYLVSPGGGALPSFVSGSDDLSTTLLGAMPAISGVAGSETAGGATHAITAAIAHETVTIPGTAGSVAAVRLDRTWNDGLSSSSMWLAKDAAGDVYVLRRERRAPSNPTAAVTSAVYPELLLPATASPPWFLGADGMCTVSTGQTSAGSNIGGCTQVLTVYGTAPPATQSLWSKPGIGLVAAHATIDGIPGDGWHLSPPGNPLPTLSSTSSAAVNGAFLVTCVFSEPVTGFAASDISISGGSISAFAGSGASYGWKVTPTANVTLSIAAGRCAALTGGLPNLASSALSRTFDAVKPTVSLSAPAQVRGPVTVTATFSEPVSGFDVGDVVVTNGGISGFAGADGRIYTWTLTPAASGVVTVGIAAGVASDDAGNTNAAASTLSRNADLIAPTVTLSTPAATAVRGAFTVTIAFSETVGGFTADDLAVSGAGKGALTTVTANRVWTCALTPLAATTGAITVQVAGGAASDAAGNANAPSAVLERIGDTIAPALTLSSEAPPTVSGPFEVLVSGQEEASGLEAGDFALGNARIGAIVYDGAIYAWICTVHPLNNGAVSVAVKAAAVADQAGNTNPATAALTRAFADATPPTVALSAMVGDFAKAAFTVTATFSEAPVGFALADIATANATVSGLAGSGSTRTFLVTPAAAGPVTVQIPAGGWSDPNNVPSAEASNLLTTTYDAVRPIPSLSSASSARVNAPFPVAIDFGEPVDGFAQADLVATNATLSDFSGADGDRSFSVVVSPTASGTVTLALAAGKATDRAGNANAAATSLTRTYDTARPTVILSTTAAAVTRDSPIAVKAAFSEAMTGLEIGDLTVGNADVVGLASSDGGRTWSLSLVPSADGEVSLLVPADAATDAAGNGNLPSAALTRTSDRTAPTITLSSAADAEIAGTFTLAIACSEAVSGLAASDVVVSNGTVVGFAGAGASYSCGIRPSALGVVTVSIAAGAAADVAGNLSLAAAPLTRTVAIVNDACIDATAISGWKGALAASNLGATAESGEPAHAGLAATASVWWMWEAPETGVLTLDTIGSLIDTQLGLYAGTTPAALTKVAANANISDTVKQSRVIASVSKGTTYRIAVDGKSGAKGLLSLNWSLVAGNNPFSGARAITGTSGSDSSGTWSATRDSGEALAKAIGAGRTVWWSYTAPTDGVLHLDSDGSGTDTVLAVASGSSASALTVLAQDDEVPGDSYAEIGIKVKAGQVYRIMADAALGAADGAVILNWSLDSPGDG